MKYRDTFRQIKAYTGGEYGTIYLVGGGARDSLLCQMTADATGLPVVAGSAETTVMGNAAAQFVALSVFGGLQEARAAIRRSFESKRYLPAQPDAWSVRYGQIQPFLAKQSAGI